MQDSLSQQRQLGTTIHTPFDEFESVHMAFERPITPRQGQACKHNPSFVLVNAFGKRFQLWQMARLCRASPGVQLLSRMLPHHPPKGLCQAVSSLCAWTGLPDEPQFALLHLVPLFWLTPKQPGGTPGREVLQR